MALGLLTPWFEAPDFTEQLEESGLSTEEADQVRQFSADGYLVFRPDIPDFDRLADDIVRALAPEHERFGSRLMDAWRWQPSVRTLAGHPAILGVLRRLYRRDPFPFQTLNFREGSQQATHSDIVHFNSIPERMMAGVWVALEDVGPDNGPLHYYPGSHRLATYHLHDLGLGGGIADRNARYQRYEDFLASLIEIEGLRKEVVSVRRGEAVVWAANLLHGGEPIVREGATRQTQVTHFFFHGCRYYNPLYSDPGLGHYSWRQVRDIRTNTVVPHEYGGRTVRLPLPMRVRYAAESGMNRSRVGRAAFNEVKRRITRT